MVSTARLGVVKQSFFGLPGQYGRRVTRANTWNTPFLLVRFVFPNTDHVISIIFWRFGPFFCSLKRVDADIFMLACALFN